MPVTPVAGVTHDITITDDDAVETGFMLWQEKAKEGEAAPRLAISRQPVLAPKQYEGFARYSDQPPEVDLTWEIESFHYGGLSNRWTPESKNRYNQANAVDAHTPYELSVANEIYSFTTYILNPFFSSSGSWTLAGGASISGGQLVLTTVGANATQALVNPSAYSSRSITVGLVCTATGVDGVARVGVVRNGINSTTDTTITAGSGAILATHTETLPAGITTLSMYIEHTSGASTTFVGDNAFVFNGDAIPRSVVEYNDRIYVACGQAVLQSNAAGSAMDAVLVGPSTCLGLGISPTDDVLIAGFGANGYYSSTNGTTWTARTGPGGPYATVRNRVWGVRDNDTVSSSVDVITPTWTDYDDIGTLNRDMTGIFASGDTVVVGREDGLWVYDRAGNLFRDITPEFQAEPHTDNFIRGMEWMGWLYTTTRRGILRYDGAEIEDVSSYFAAPQIADFGGRIKALAHDGNRAYIMTDTPSTDASTSKQTFLMSFREIIDDSGESRFVVHPIHFITAGDQRLMTVFNNGTDTRLYSFGQLFSAGTTYYPFFLYMKVPARHDSPARDVTPDFALTGAGAEPNAIITQYWDGLLPDAQKAFVSLTLRADGSLTAGTRQVIVTYQLDESTTWTSLGTISTAGVQTLYFSTAALADRRGRRIRLRFELQTDSLTLGPRIIMPIVLHAVYRPVKRRAYEFTVLVGDGLRLRSGGTEDVTAATMMTRLDGYLDDTWVSVLREDEDGDGTVTTHNIFITDVQRLRYIDSPNPGAPAGVWLYKITAVQQVIS